MQLKILELIPMLTNSNQYQSMPHTIMYSGVQPIKNANRHWEVLRGIDWLREESRINSIILIGIDRRWLALGVGRGSPVISVIWSTIGLLFSYTFPRLTLQPNAELSIGIWQPLYISTYTTTSIQILIWTNIMADEYYAWILN